MPDRCAIYCRISVDAGGEGLGVGRQERDCRELAERRGWPVAEVFVDNDVSAWGGKRRPAYERMLEAIKTGEVDAVVVWHLDRLTRRPIELERFFETCDAAGVRHLACVTGDVDLATHDGQFMARILGAVARKESDDKSRRTKRKHQELAEAGRAVGGTRPFGYGRDRVTVLDDEAELIREACRRVLAGESLWGIAMDWNHRDVATSRGGQWAPTTLRRILLNPRLIGKRTWEGAVVADGEWPAIVDDELFARVGAALMDPRRFEHPNWQQPRRHVLSGLLVCGRCGHKLQSQASERYRAARYACVRRPGSEGCGRLRVVAPPLEECVALMLFARVDSPELAAAISGGEYEGAAAELLQAIADDEAALERASHDHYVDRITDRATFVAVSQTLQQRIAARRRQLIRVSTRQAAAEWAGRGAELERRWAAAQLPWKRAVLDAYIESITVGWGTKMPGFEEARLTAERDGGILWRR